MDRERAPRNKGEDVVPELGLYLLFARGKVVVGIKDAVCAIDPVKRRLYRIRDEV